MRELITVALSYGVARGQSLSALFDLSVDTVNENDIFRAIMGELRSAATLD